MIEWIAQRVKHMRLIIGADFKLHDSKMAAKILAAADSAKHQLSASARLMDKMAAGDLEVKSSTIVIDHRKLYLLHAQDGAVRSIYPSANCSKSAWEQQKQIEQYHFDDTRMAFDTYSEEFETSWAFAQEIPYKTLLVKESADPVQNNPILSGVEKSGEAYVIQIPEEKKTIKEYRYAIDEEKALQQYDELCTNAGLSGGKNGLIKITPTSISKIKLNTKKAATRKADIETVQEQYPRLTVDYDNQQALLNGDILSDPTDEEVRSDIELLLGVFQNYESFVGVDPRKQQATYFKILNLMFASPFFARLRCEANFTASSPDRCLPLFMLVSSTHSDTGKTFFIRVMLKMMTGKSNLPIFGTKKFKSTEASAFHANSCGIPLLIDEVNNTFLTNMQNSIKTIDQICDQQQHDQIAMLIFTSNDATAPDATLRKRMAFFNPEGTIPSDVDQVAWDSIGKGTISKVGNALYRVYLKRMIPQVQALIDKMDSAHDSATLSGWYPDIMPSSSETLIEILQEYGLEVPSYAKKLSWNHDFATNSAGAINDAMSDVCELYNTNPTAFCIEKATVTVTLGSDKSSRKRMETWRTTLPHEVIKEEPVYRLSGYSIVFNKAEFEKRSGIKFKKKLFGR